MLIDPAVIFTFDLILIFTFDLILIIIPLVLFFKKVFIVMVEIQIIILIWPVETDFLIWLGLKDYWLKIEIVGFRLISFSETWVAFFLLKNYFFPHLASLIIFVFLKLKAFNVRWFNSILSHEWNCLFKFLSVDQKYSKEGEIETYEQPLVTFYLSVRPNEKISTRFYPMWFNINRQSDTLYLKFFDASTDEKLKSNCTIITTLLLRKVA